MQAFVLNRHGRMVFPSNLIPELDFSTVESLDQLDRVIRRDFEMKAPTGTDILERITNGGYDSRYTLMRDLALNLFWANRFAMTMYDKRPTRWADVPRQRSDVFLPVLTPWEGGDEKVQAVRSAYDALPAAWDDAAEDRIVPYLVGVDGWGLAEVPTSGLPAQPESIGAAPARLPLVSAAGTIWQLASGTWITLVRGAEPLPGTQPFYPL